MLIKSRILFFLIFIPGIWFCFSQQNKIDNGITTYSLADKLYWEAERLSASPVFDSIAELKQEKLNSRALTLFKIVISNAARSINDSLLFHSYVKAGLLEHYFDSLPQARSFYLKALEFRAKLPHLEDSFFFKPDLFAGSIYYSQNIFDTALTYYKQAEKIADKYKGPLEEMERLYNRMGVMYYETGNYRLANTYFEKAITLLSTANPSYQDLLINYKMNIASISINLEEFEKANSIFTSIIPFNIHLNEIYHNMGIINMRLKKNGNALLYFRRVNYGNNAKNIDLYSNMAETYSNLGQKDSSQLYINKAIAENKRINGYKKNTSMGLLLKFMGDEKINNNAINDGLSFYQQAICQFYPAYNDPDIHSDPEEFSGVFSYIQLYNTLVAKGDAFRKSFRQIKNKADLEASFNAYRSAFILADHIAGTYDSDEARFFLNKIKYKDHDKAIQSSLALYEITADKYYLEQAYLFDQRNKASALTLALQENNMLKEAGRPQELSLQQATLRSVITRLSLKTSQITDSIALSGISNEIRDNEIKLSKIQEQINKDPKYAFLQPGIHIPSTRSLQSMLDNETTLLSYHLSENELLVFRINKEDFDYVRSGIDSSFLTHALSFVNSLHNLDDSKRYSGAMDAAELYKVLIKPVLSKIKISKRLIIIPDDELNYIAFEALQDEQKRYLLQAYAIQYQFSTALLQLNEMSNVTQNQVLAFAPFADNIAGNSFKNLPYSKQEVAGLTGKVFLNNEATKEHFIENANKYPIVQLATHAVANDSLPGRSFIAFYPARRDNMDENILYAREIYNLRLDSINLVILSACETGSGQLVRGEGLMSITRAFAYAGCPNIITSLWKASDKTTAFITQRLHFYLDKGYSKDRALQLAKLDMLDSKEIAPSLKTPNYWAHLVLIGNYEHSKKTFSWIWLITGLSLVVLICLSFLKKKVPHNCRTISGFS